MVKKHRRYYVFSTYVQAVVYLPVLKVRNLKWWKRSLFLFTGVQEPEHVPEGGGQVQRVVRLRLCDSQPAALHHAPWSQGKVTNHSQPDKLQLQQKLFKSFLIDRNDNSQWELFKQMISSILIFWHFIWTALSIISTLTWKCKGFYWKRVGLHRMRMASRTSSRKWMKPTSSK